MASKAQFELYAFNTDSRYRIVTTICQTLNYGVYLCLITIAVHVTVTNGLQNRARKWLLVTTTSMFTLSTVDWILSVDYTFLLTNAFNAIVKACYGEDNASFCLIEKRITDFISPQSLSRLLMFNSILLVNYIFADGIIVWQTWVLCSDQSKVVLMIPVIMLVINIVIYLIVVVGTAILLTLKEPKGWVHDFGIFIEGNQFTYPALSLLINIFATSIIALKAWKYRKLLVESEMIRTPTGAIRILVLLVESGVIYVLISVTIFASLIISLRVGHEEVTTACMHLGMQLVGMYPIVVIILVELNRSLDTTFSSFSTLNDLCVDRRSQAEPMTFAPRLVLTSGRQIESAINPQETDTYNVTSLGPGDAGMSAENSKLSGEEHADSYLSTSPE